MQAAGATPTPYPSYRVLLHKNQELAKAGDQQSFEKLTNVDSFVKLAGICKKILKSKKSTKCPSWNPIKIITYLYHQARLYEVIGDLDRDLKNIASTNEIIEEITSSFQSNPSDITQEESLVFFQAQILAEKLAIINNLYAPLVALSDEDDPSAKMLKTHYKATLKALSELIDDPMIKHAYELSLISENPSGEGARVLREAVDRNIHAMKLEREIDTQVESIRKAEDLSTEADHSPAQLRKSYVALLKKRRAYFKTLTKSLSGERQHLQFLSDYASSKDDKFWIDRILTEINDRTSADDSKLSTRKNIEAKQREIKNDIKKLHSQAFSDTLPSMVELSNEVSQYIDNCISGNAHATKKIKKTAKKATALHSEIVISELKIEQLKRKDPQTDQIRFDIKQLEVQVEKNKLKLNGLQSKLLGFVHSELCILVSGRIQNGEDPESLIEMLKEINGHTSALAHPSLSLSKSIDATRIELRDLQTRAPVTVTKKSKVKPSKKKWELNHLGKLLCEIDPLKQFELDDASMVERIEESNKSDRDTKFVNTVNKLKIAKKNLKTKLRLKNNKLKKLIEKRNSDEVFSETEQSKQLKLEKAIQKERDNLQGQINSMDKSIHAQFIEKILEKTSQINAVVLEKESRIKRHSKLKLDYKSKIKRYRLTLQNTADPQKEKQIHTNMATLEKSIRDVTRFIIMDQLAIETAKSKLEILDIGFQTQMEEYGQVWKKPDQDIWATVKSLLKDAVLFGYWEGIPPRPPDEYFHEKKFADSGFTVSVKEMKLFYDDLATKFSTSTPEAILEKESKNFLNWLDQDPNTAIHMVTDLAHCISVFQGKEAHNIFMTTVKAKVFSAALIERKVTSYSDLSKEDIKKYRHYYLLSKMLKNAPTKITVARGGVQMLRGAGSSISKGHVIQAGVRTVIGLGKMATDRMFQKGVQYANRNMSTELAGYALQYMQLAQKVFHNRMFFDTVVVQNRIKQLKSVGALYQINRSFLGRTKFHFKDWIDTIRFSSSFPEGLFRSTPAILTTGSVAAVAGSAALLSLPLVLTLGVIFIPASLLYSFVAFPLMVGKMKWFAATTKRVMQHRAKKWYDSHRTQADNYRKKLIENLKEKRSLPAGKDFYSTEASQTILSEAKNKFSKKFKVIDTVYEGIVSKLNSNLDQTLPPHDKFHQAVSHLTDAIFLDLRGIETEIRKEVVQRDDEASDLSAKLSTEEKNELIRHLTKLTYDKLLTDWLSPIVDDFVKEQIIQCAENEYGSFYPDLIEKQSTSASPTAEQIAREEYNKQENRDLRGEFTEEEFIDYLGDFGGF